MNYKVIDTNPLSWKVVKTVEPLSDECFATIDEVKEYLIETCKFEIAALNAMIEEVDKIEYNKIEINITKEQLKNIGELSKLFSKYVNIKPAGINYKSDCPFCKAKDTMFISDGRDIYKCMSCGLSGDKITFLLEMESL